MFSCTTQTCSIFLEDCGFSQYKISLFFWLKPSDLLLELALVRAQFTAQLLSTQRLSSLLHFVFTRSSHLASDCVSYNQRTEWSTNPSSAPQIWKTLRRDLSPRHFYVVSGGSAFVWPSYLLLFTMVFTGTPPAQPFIVLIGFSFFHCLDCSLKALHPISILLVAAFKMFFKFYFIL